MRGSFSHAGPVLENAGFSPDGSILATAGGNRVKLWNWSTKSSSASWREDLKCRVWLSLARRGEPGNGRRGAGRRSAVRRQWATRAAGEFRGHQSGVYSVVFALDDQSIISAGEDGTIRIWSLRDGKQLGVHQGHKGRVWTLALSADGRTIASAGQDGTIKLWDTDMPSEQLEVPISNHVVCYEFSPDGRTLRTLDWGNPCVIERWDAHSGSCLERTPLSETISVQCAAFSLDNQLLAIQTKERALTLSDTATGRRLSVLDPNPAFIERYVCARWPHHPSTPQGAQLVTPGSCGWPNDTVSSGAARVF